jgi:spermidine synthase
VENPPRSLRAAALTGFFLSGFAALVYQVVWQRLLIGFSGADVYSSTLIVAAFMAGLGVGNLAGGHLADRVSRRKALILFGAAELLIAGFAVASRSLYYDFLYQRLGTHAFGMPVLTAILFASLLWPTFFMGVSLPLLARAVTPGLERAAATIGALYACNTIGAAAGAFAATWWILPAIGLAHSLQVGALLNLACAVVVLPFSLGVPARSETTDAPVNRAGPAGTQRAALPFAAWAAIYALSGFMALSLEIVWFRLLGVMMKSTAFTFGTLLAIYLSGLGLGAALGSRLAPVIRRPVSVFLSAQAVVGCSAGLLLAAALGAADDVEWLRRYFGSYDPFSVRQGIDRLRQGAIPHDFLVLYFGLPASLILIPTALMGFCFPILQRIVHDDYARLGRRVGMLMLANIGGSVVGTVATGWIALDRLGTAGTLRAISVIGMLFLLGAVVFTLRGRSRWAGVAAVGILSVGLLRLLPPASFVWARLHGTTVARMVFGEDATGLSVFRLEPGSAEGRTTVFVNGVGQSTIPYGDVHTGLGMVPAFLHPNPREVAVIGLGSGDTLYGIAGRQEIERITCIEIVAPQIEGLKQVRHRYGYGGLVGLFDDPRIQYQAGDGRIFLMHSPAKFDIIEADALRPSSAYSGNLYSEEYFTLMRSRLRPRGLAATWLPTARVHNAFVRVFPYVVSVPGILVGSNDPIAVDRGQILQRLADARVREHYARAGINAEELMSSYLVNPARYTPDFNRAALTDFNTDLFPRDEFDLSAPSQ